MKQNKIWFFSIILLLSLVLAACKPAATPVYIEGEESDRVAEAAEPIAAGILEGIRTDDYELFTTAFNEKLQSALNETQFAGIVGMYGKLGQSESMELLNIEDKQDYYGLNYKLTYPDKVVIMLVVLTKTEPYQVSGLWFK